MRKLKVQSLGNLVKQQTNRAIYLSANFITWGGLHSWLLELQSFLRYKKSGEKGPREVRAQWEELVTISTSWALCKSPCGWFFFLFLKYILKLPFCQLMTWKIYFETSRSRMKMKTINLSIFHSIQVWVVFFFFSVKNYCSYDTI